jgi:hypothetical protein
VNSLAHATTYEALPRDYQPQQTQVERQQSQQTTIASVTLEIKVEVEDTTSDGRRVLIVWVRKGGAYPTFTTLGLIEVKIVPNPSKDAAHVLFG